MGSVPHQMNTCQACGYSALGSSTSCERCGRPFGSFPSPTALPNPSAPRLRPDLDQLLVVEAPISRGTPKLLHWLLWAGLGIGVALGIELTLTARLKLELDRDLEKLAGRHQQEMDSTRASEEQRIQLDEANFARVLSDPSMVGGVQAKQRQREEWARRQKHDPSLANTEMEKRLLQMERLGASPEVAAQQALEQVAQLASPSESKVEIAPQQGGYHVRVAFKLSSRKGEEAGAVTRHLDSASLQREVEEVSASVMRDLYDFCGNRSITGVTVACNRAVRQWDIVPGATKAEQERREREAKSVMSCIYRASMSEGVARTIASWRGASLSQVISKLNVEMDTTQSIRIRQNAGNPSERVDPKTELKFE